MNILTIIIFSYIVIYAGKMWNVCIFHPTASRRIKTEKVKKDSTHAHVTSRAWWRVFRSSWVRVLCEVFGAVGRRTEGCSAPAVGARLKYVNRKTDVKVGKT